MKCKSGFTAGFNYTIDYFLNDRIKQELLKIQDFRRKYAFDCSKIKFLKLKSKPHFSHCSIFELDTRKIFGTLAYVI